MTSPPSEPNRTQHITLQLQVVDVSKLDPHPQNPRLVLRDEVIEGIAKQILARGGFDADHAPIVRPLPLGRFQIVAGHHRVAGAVKAGLLAIPCRVREMSDEDAFMTLVVDNTQAELSPLEIGIHALRAVKLGVGGSGKKGGLSAYAERIGRTQQYVSQLRNAGEVLVALKPTSQLVGFMDKAQHLMEIHSAPQEHWADLATRMLAEGWTAARSRREARRLADPKRDEAGAAVGAPDSSASKLDRLEVGNALDQRRQLVQLAALAETTQGLVTETIASGRANSVKAAQRFVAQATLDAGSFTCPPSETRVSTPATDSSRSVVIDPFAGAASTGIAAIREDRHFLGIELHEANADEAASRLLNETGVDGSLVDVRDLVLPSGPSPTWAMVRGDARTVLGALPAQTAACCITSPPYLWARSYGTSPQVWGGAADCMHEWRKDGPRAGKAAHFSGRVCGKCSAWFGELGHERSVEEYVAHLALVFEEIKRTLRDDGTMWLNLGDAYESGELVGVPWQVAFALKSSGWILRRDVIWARGASGQRTVADQVRRALDVEGISDSQRDVVLGRLDFYVGSTKPESVEDRPAGSHEYLFLFAKSSDYFYDGRAVRETSEQPDKRPRRVGGTKGLATQDSLGGIYQGDGKRNLRSVWLCPTVPYHGAHVAPFPPELVRPCVVACTVPLASSDVGLAPAPAQRPEEATPAASPPGLSAAAPTDVLEPGEAVSASPASEPSEAPRFFVGVVLGRDGYTGMIDSTGSVLVCSPVPMTRRRGAKSDPDGVARLVESWASAGVEEVVFEPSDDPDLALWTDALAAHCLRHGLAPSDWRGRTKDAEAVLAFPDHCKPTERSRSSRSISYPKVRALLMARYLMLSRTGDTRRLELEILGRRVQADTRHITPTQAVLAYLDAAIERGLLDPKASRSPLTPVVREVALLVELASRSEFDGCWTIMRMSASKELDPSHMEAMRKGVYSAQQVLKGGLGRPPARSVRGQRGRPCA